MVGQVQSDSERFVAVGFMFTSDLDGNDPVLMLCNGSSWATYAISAVVRKAGTYPSHKLPDNREHTVLSNNNSVIYNYHTDLNLN